MAVRQASKQSCRLQGCLLRADWSSEAGVGEAEREGEGGNLGSSPPVAPEQPGKEPPGQPSRCSRQEAFVSLSGRVLLLGSAGLPSRSRLPPSTAVASAFQNPSLQLLHFLLPLFGPAKLEA